MDFECWAVFVGDAEDPVYIWDDAALELFAMACVAKGFPVEIFGVCR